MSTLIRFSLVLALLLTGCTAGGKNLTNDQREKQAKSHYQLGIDALNKGLLPKAFDELMQSDAALPNQPHVQDALAYCWRLRGNLDKAESYYRKSIRLDSKVPATHNNYANLLLDMKRYKDAESEARKALEDPRYLNQHLAYMNLGDALLEQDHFNEAITAYRQAGAFAPGNPLPGLKEAAAYIRYDRLNYAEALLATMLRSHPDNRGAVQLLVALQTKQGDLPAARKTLQTFIEKTQNDLNRAWAKDELDKLP